MLHLCFQLFCFAVVALRLEKTGGFVYYLLLLLCFCICVLFFCVLCFSFFCMYTSSWVAFICFVRCFLLAFCLLWFVFCFAAAFCFYVDFFSLNNHLLLWPVK